MKNRLAVRAHDRPRRHALIDGTAPDRADSQHAADAPTGGLLRRAGGRLWSAILAVWAAITGIAPHVLHHVGPLAGAAVVSGALGTAIFGAVGVLASVPFLLRLRRRFDSWLAPLIALMIFVIVFTVSTLVVGPRIAGSEAPVDTANSDAEHLEHHE